VRGITALPLLAIMVLCSACDKDAQKTVVPADAPHGVVAPAAAATVPAEQTAFTKGVALAESGGPAGQGFCSDFQKMPGFENWIGTITDFRTSTINGAIDITFDMGGVRFEQVVQKANPVYASVEPLLVGARVQMSGQFSHGNGECGYSLRTISVGIKKVQPY
jgi:hypothetical protein